MPVFLKLTPLFKILIYLAYKNIIILGEYIDTKNQIYSNNQNRRSKTEDITSIDKHTLASEQMTRNEFNYLTTCL